MRGVPASIAAAGILALGLALAGCVPAADAGKLAPTLSMVAVRGGEVAIQDGIPVPTFAYQPRGRVELDGAWRVERRTFDSNLSLTPRSSSLDRITADAGGRQLPQFDDSAWGTVDVPGSLNPPPDRRETGAWYRRNVTLPAGFAGRTILLRFGAANYIADVWLNGVWLGYHEGGTTPFAFDASAASRPGEPNVLAVRVDNPPWGTRNDIVPWGLADWWNFGGLTRPVWFEASDPVHAVRADVVPHLDGADVSVVVENSGSTPADAQVSLEVLPARVTTANLLSPDPRSLLLGGGPIARQDLPAETLARADVVRLDSAFLIADAATWTPLSPSLYVLRVTVTVGGAVVDTLLETFGLRQVAVDPDGPSVVLNGQRVAFPGAAVHDQILTPTPGGGVTGHIPTPVEIRDELRAAQTTGARLIRTGHTPANPALLDLADRLGFAVWEEIPLYHYTPQTFAIAMGRGIPQQMLREMALRDMNRPSVLFHGLANESTGEDQRTRALQQLHDIDRAIDGTRLTGQAAYGFTPDDPTSSPLDVAGYTFYHGVFYGTDPRADTEAALELAHETYPKKPVVVLEFGRWADGPGGPAAQRRIFTETAGPLLANRSTLDGGFVSAAVWWTLEDYATLRPNIAIEHFGLFAEDGAARPVADAIRTAFGSLSTGLDAPPRPPTVAGGRPVATSSAPSGPVLLGYLAYGLAGALATLGAAFFLLVRRGGRGRGHSTPSADTGL
ncbi:MAG TPA: glycoside hydrolase family 2 TIM barrel-domain containing protein [Candidatus Limnocylindrales bacterium]